MNTFLFAFALQCFLPLNISPGDFFGLSLVNRDLQSRDFTITATSADGTTAQSGRVSLPGGGQRAVLLNEVLGTATPANGWVNVESPSSDCPVYSAIGSPDSLAGTDASGVLSMNVVLPQVEINTGFQELNHTDTFIAIVNPGSSSATVQVRLHALDGVVRGTAPISVPARGSFTGRVSEMFASALPSNSVGGKTFQGYIRLNADQNIAAWHRIEMPLARAILRGRAVEEIKSTSLAIIPHFVFGGTYGSFINLVNPTSATVDLDLSAHDDRGNVIGEIIQVRLAPGESRRSSVGEFFRVVIIQIFPPPVITGYIRIRERQGGAFQIVGDVEIVGLWQGAFQSAMLYPLSDTASRNWLLPFVTGSSEYFTGYAVANPNELLTVQTDVTVEVVDSGGTVRSSTTTSLSPRHHFATLVPSGVVSGYLRITANMPIHVLGSIGTRDERSLEQLPAIPYQ